MFKKLRNRFLIVNLVTISVMMLVAFATIYIINYLNVQNDIRMDLQRITEAFQKPGSGEHRGGGIGDGIGGSPDGGTDTGTQRQDIGGGSFGRMGGSPPPERSISFMIETDNDWQQTGTPVSQLSMDDEFYAQALQEAVDMNKTTGRFELDAVSGPLKSSPPLTGICLFSWTSPPSRRFSRT
ncbi:hypothetical protein [Paenibacillus sp. DMB5]|uniref:hypothetical protein n=1 Tax=Paenibacillus sp. DMB5 TaxID=1780103 RepID=UPI000AE69AEA